MSSQSTPPPSSSLSSSSPNNPLKTTPFTTLLFAATCIVIHVGQLLFDYDLQNITICPRLILYLNEYYRIITSALFHANLMHIGMNLMSLFAIGTMLEKQVGTIYMFLTICWAIILCGFVYTFIAWIAYIIGGFDEYMYTHSVGFSGILFHLSVLECNLLTSSSSSSSRSLFGFATIPAYLYPWALLILLQFLIPGLSFLGHLSGILTGTMQYYGLFTKYLFVSESFIRDEMESSSSNWIIIKTIQTKFSSNFCPIPTQSIIGLNRNQNPSSSFFSAIKNGIKMVWKFICDVIETFSVCIFGRGRMMNRNIRFSNPFDGSSNDNNSGGGTGGVQLGGGRVLGTASLDDDDDWNGLPLISTSEQQQHQQRREQRHISRLV